MMCLLAFVLPACSNESNKHGVPKKIQVEPIVTCLDRAANNQDDMCIWIHPDNPALSTVIVADKKAEKLFVYDLAGKTIQTVATPKPGNIDVRYGFSLGGRNVDIVAFNQRVDDYKVLIYCVDPHTRHLERIDNGTIKIAEKNSGGTLYHSAKTGSFYFFVTSYSGTVEQFQLIDNGNNSVGGRKVRSWTLGFCEGAVADDEAGTLYVAEEDVGVWQIGAEPDDSTPGELAIKGGRKRP